MGGEYELRVRELPFQKSTNLPAVSCIDGHEHGVEDREREYSGLFSYRFSNYRIICRIRQKKLYIVVLRVRRRNKVYDGLHSFFRKGTSALGNIPLVKLKKTGNCWVRIDTHLPKISDSDILNTLTRYTFVR